MRTAIIQHLRDLLQAKSELLQREVRETRAARDADTKSSAGDKHEVGRAMMQQELDRCEAQFRLAQEKLAELDRLPTGPFDRVAVGSLVTTDRGLFLVALAFGRLEVAGTSITVLSLASPLGSALKGRGTGDRVDLNGVAYRVLAVE